MKRQLIERIAILFISFLIILGGCSFAPNIWNSGSDTSNIVSKTVKSINILKKTIQASEGINFTQGDFSVVIPPNSLPQDTEILITKMPAYTLPIASQHNFSQQSSIYTISTSPLVKYLQIPAKITFVNNNSKTVANNIYAACRYTDKSWSFLNPDLANSNSASTFTTTHFSDWVLVSKNEVANTNPENSPILTASPSKMIASNKGYFSQNLQIDTTFTLSASNSNLIDNKLSLTLYNLKSNGITLYSPDTPSINQTLKPDISGVLEIDLLTNSFTNISKGMNSATATIWLKYEGKPIDNVNLLLPWKLVHKAQNKDTYEANGAIEFAKSNIPDLSLPAVTEIYPSNEATRVPVNTNLSFKFTKKIATNTFITAFSISPTISLENIILSWNDQSNAVNVNFSNNLTDLTTYTVQLSSDLTDIDGLKIPQSISSTFFTGDSVSPVVLEFTPKSSETIPTNGAIDFSFSEVIATSTLDISVSPASAIVVEWSKQNTKLTITPSSTWIASTTYQIVISNLLKDLFGNNLSENIQMSFNTNRLVFPEILSFTPPNGYSSASVTTDLVTIFNHAMDTQTVEDAIIVLPSPPLPIKYLWSNENKTLTQSFNSNLDFSTKYSFSIASSAQNASGLPLIKQYSYQFTTEQRPYIISQSVSPQNDSTNIASNTVVTLEFSTTMNQQSVEKAFSLIDEQNKQVLGRFNWVLNKVTFEPNTLLKPGQKYRLIVNASAKSVANHSISVWLSAFTTQAATSPTIKAITPLDKSTNVSYKTDIKIAFSEKMASSSVIVSLSPSPVENSIKSWSQNGKELTISYPSGLESSSLYTITISPQSKSLFYIPLTGQNTFEFTIETFDSPKLASILPSTTSSDVTITASFTFLFSLAMDKSKTEQAFSIEPSIGSYSFLWTKNTKKLTVTPLSNLNYGTNYKIGISEAATSALGQRIIRAQTSSFNTSFRPVVSSYYPASASTDLATNTQIIVEFSKEMDHSSTEKAFTIYTSSEQIAGTFAWTSKKLWFTPDSPLPFTTHVFVKIASDAKDISNISLGQNHIMSFTTISANKPSIVSTYPAANSTNIPYGSNIQIEFSEPMASATVSVVITPPINNLTQTWDATSKRLNITHANPFESNTLYNVSINADALSVAGGQITGSKDFNFTTETILNAVVIKTYPISEAINVLTDTDFSVSFNKSMATSSVENAFSISPSSGQLAFQWSNDNKVATISASTPLLTNTNYLIKVLSTAKDYQNFEMQSDFVSSFTTEVAPLVSSVNILNNAINVATDSIINILFNKEMDRSTAQQAFSLIQGTQNKICSFSWVGNTMHCAPQTALLPDTIYTIIVSQSASDIRNNQLASFYSSEFATVKSPNFTVASKFPISNSNNVLIDTNVIFTFTNSVLPSSLNSTFMPAPAGGYSFSWSNDNKNLTFTTGRNLAGNQNYTVTIASTVKDIFNKPLGLPSVINFHTETLTIPSVVSTLPAAGSYDIPIASNFVVTFDKAMNKPSVIDAFSISPLPLGIASYTWNSAATELYISFSGVMSHYTSYLVTIASNAKDINGLSLNSNYLSPFQTAKRPEIVLNSIQPPDDSAGIGTNTTIVITFTKLMDQLATENSLSLKLGANIVNGTFAWLDKTLTFTPSNPLMENSEYTVSINTNAKDELNNHLAAPFSWTFNTVSPLGKIWRKDRSETYNSNLFAQRKDHVMISYDNSLWVIGGTNGETLNDVWKSSNGVNWNKLLASTSTPLSTQFSPRAGHSCVVFDNKLWLTGGYTVTEASGITYLDDVWNTTNGITWNRVNPSAAYFSRAHHCMASFDGKLWLMAGKTYDQNETEVLLDDSWSSTDGVTWVQKSNIVSFFPRFRASCGVINNKLWVWGGYGRGSDGIEKALNDIWKTSSGDIWQLNSQPAAFLPRCGAATAHFNSRFWILGGSSHYTEDAGLYYNDIWTTSDGVNWNQMLPNTVGSTNHFSPRAYYSASSIGGRLYISGGVTSNALTNEVWSTE